MIGLAAGSLMVLIFLLALFANPLFRDPRNQLDGVIERFRELREEKIAELLLLLDRGFNSHLSDTLSAEQAAWAWNAVQRERETRARIILEDMRANIGCCLQLARIGLLERQRRSANDRARFEAVTRDLVNATAACQLGIAAIECDLLSGTTLDTIDTDMAAMLQLVGERLAAEYQKLIEKALAICEMQGGRYKDALSLMVGCAQHSSLVVMPRR